MRAYGLPGIRQTRWIVGKHHLMVDEVRAGVKFDDAAARTAWPLEQHHNAEGYVWEPFAADHVHYVPLGSMIPPDADNIVAAGRCNQERKTNHAGAQCVRARHVRHRGLHWISGGSGRQFDVE